MLEFCLPTVEEFCRAPPSWVGGVATVSVLCEVVWEGRLNGATRKRVKPIALARHAHCQ